MGNTETELNQSLTDTLQSIAFIKPELFLGCAILLILIVGLALRKSNSLPIVSYILALGVVILSMVFTIGRLHFGDPLILFNGLISIHGSSGYLQLLCDIGAAITLLMSLQKGVIKKFYTEYAALLLTILLGSHLLLMTSNFIILLLALEMISLSSYVLTGFSGTKEGAEGSFKYFIFGSVVTAVMVYGFSILYGLTGTLDFASPLFVNELKDVSLLFTVAGVFALTGFFFKVAAVPLHPWAPDVYQAAPMPVVAFFSVVPKLAGLGVIIQFSAALHAAGNVAFDWQLLLGVVAGVSILMGNFSALLQKNVKRMMAYSSIAQTGFLLAGLTAFSLQGVQFVLFYAGVYVFMNYLVFIYLQYFEQQGINHLEEFSGTGKQALLPNILLLVGLISLTGLPPTAGFTAKLFIFSGLWESYAANAKPILLWLLIFGLINTVVSLFYYLRIPFYAFLKPSEPALAKYPAWVNFLGMILVFVVLLLFFQPNVLMSWINKFTFTL